MDVLKKEIHFEKSQPIIKIVKQGETSKSKPKKPRPTKRKKEMKEDATLWKRLKGGDQVKRNERQQKFLDDLKSGII